MKRLVVAGALAVAALAVVLVASAASGVTSNGFEVNTSGWSNNAGTITQQPSPYVNPGGYASGIDAADGSFFAGLNRGPCSIEVGGGGNTIRCSGPYTDWGDLTRATWHGTYTTQVDIYLDAAYANDPLNEDSYGGNLALATGANSTDPSYKGTRFDYTSAINDNTGAHLRDFGFVVGTGQPGNTCTGWTVNAQMDVNRINAFPDDSSKNPACIADSGWYTFKHTFFENADHNLEVLMQIIPKSGGAPVASWSIVSGDTPDTPDPISTVGCNRYGWFSNQEIWGLPIDNAKIEGGCVGPTITGGQIAPTKTTCQAYNSGTADTLEQVLYTLKGDTINSVSPGVFFYYGTISGTEGDEFTIDQTPPGDLAPLPVQHGQVILYDTNCNVVKWTPDTEDNGVVTGMLPATGTFIISVKYSTADLKGVSDPAGPVEYKIGGTSVMLAPKFP